MNRDRIRLRRLRRLERLRHIAKEKAAAEAAQAESVLAKLRRTTERTRQLAEEYARCRDLADGASLRRHMDFMRQLGWLSDRAERELVSAQSLADGSQVRLAAAERQRAAVEERAEKHARSLAKPAYEAALGARRRLGTELD